MKIEIRSAQHEAEIIEAYTLATQVFGPNYFAAQEAKKNLQTLDPMEDVRDAIVAISGKEIVGFIRIVNRSVRIGGASLPVGGVTSVCLHPRLRGKKLGRKLMEHAVERLQQREDALSITFARRAVDGFYPKFGYVGLGCHPELTIQKYPSKPALKLRHDYKASDAETCAQAYEHSYKPLFMNFQRSENWWASFPTLLARIAPDHFCLLLKGKKTIGYFIAKSGQIFELAALAGSEEDVLAGAIHALLKTQAEATFRLPLEHWAFKILKNINHTLKVRYCWDGGHLVRVMSGSRFLKANAARAIKNLIAAGSQSTSLPTWSLLDEF